MITAQQAYVRSLNVEDYNSLISLTQDIDKGIIDATSEHKFSFETTVPKKFAKILQRFYEENGFGTDLDLEYYEYSKQAVLTLYWHYGDIR